jgi:hypothetical protein
MGTQNTLQLIETNHCKNYMECLPDDAILEIGLNLSYENIMQYYC